MSPTFGWLQLKGNPALQYNGRFDRIVTPRFTKDVDVDELRTWLPDIHELFKPPQASISIPLVRLEP